jgi:hypothetical protein
VGINFSSTVQTLAFFLLAYVLGDSFLLISQKRNCVGGVFRESLCAFSYIIVCRFVCLFFFIVVVVGGGDGGVSSVSFYKR